MKDILERRAAIVRGIRKFFDDQGFVEVETAVRIEAPAPEEHIDCPPVAGGGYLRASPELQMKKLLAAGMDLIYQIGPCFREGERGSRHNPEFTMIEWYRRGADYRAIMDDMERLMRSFGTFAPFGRLRVRDAYLKYAGWDPWRTWDQDRFDFDMATVIEPAIKERGGGVFLMDYPPQAASLSLLAADDGAPDLVYAQRWEFYYDGMELANCFTELCDAEEQRKRFYSARNARKELGESDYPIDEGFLACLPAIGRAAGIALGVDRLIMVLTNTKEISAVRAGM